MILDDVEVAATRAELTDIITTLLDRVSPHRDVVARADKAAKGQIDLELWNRLVREVGAVGLTVPEELGGGGATFAEASVIFELLGRRVVAVPFLGSFLAVEALVCAGDWAVRAKWLEPLMTGERRGAVVWSDSEVVATPVGDDWTVTGSLDLVIDGYGADVLVLPARTAEGVRWFAVDLTGTERTRRETLDLTRELAAISLASAPAMVLTPDAGPEALGDRLRDLATAALAVEQLGVAEQVVADAVAYAKVREQFGRAIGSFQAIKHLLADMATEADLARSLVEHAIWAACASTDELPRAAAMAMLAASRAAVFASAENIQVHGAIGFSWEHPAHLYFRKARSNEALVGSRADLADRVLDGYGVRS